jgi:hypothetical protein
MAALHVDDLDGRGVIKDKLLRWLPARPACETVSMGSMEAVGILLAPVEANRMALRDRPSGLLGVKLELDETVLGTCA